MEEDAEMEVSRRKKERISKKQTNKTFSKGESITMKIKLI